MVPAAQQENQAALPWQAAQRLLGEAGMHMTATVRCRVDEQVCVEAAHSAPQLRSSEMVESWPFLTAPSSAVPPLRSCERACVETETVSTPLLYNFGERSPKNLMLWSVILDAERSRVLTALLDAERCVCCMRAP